MVVIVQVIAAVFLYSQPASETKSGGKGQQELPLPVSSLGTEK